MSMKTATKSLVSIRAAVAVLALIASVLVISRPECAGKLLDAVFHGTAGGLLVGGVKAANRTSRLTPTHVVFVNELVAGLLGGWLLGLILALGVFF